MSMFKSLNTDSSIAAEKDSLGGGGTVPSGLYDLTIKAAYVTIAKSEAMGVNLICTTDTGKELRFTEWVTSGKEKGGKNYYEDKNGEKHFLPGFNNINAVCLLAAGVALTDVETEKRKIMLYSYDAGKEVPTEVDVISELTGKQITFGIQEVRENKTVFNESLGKRTPTNDERKSNQINKVFRTRDHLTVAEVRAGTTEAEFYSQWDKKFSGNLVDKFKEVSSAPAGASAGAPKQSLFS